MAKKIEYLLVVGPGTDVGNTLHSNMKSAYAHAEQLVEDYDLPEFWIIKLEPSNVHVYYGKRKETVDRVEWSTL